MTASAVSILPPSSSEACRLTHKLGLFQLPCRKIWYNKRNTPDQYLQFFKKESMFPIALFLDLPDCSIEQVSSTQEAIIISISSTQEGAICSDCGEFSSSVHSTYTRSPKTLPSGGRPVRLLLQVRRFCCSVPNCHRKTFAEPFPHLVAPHAQWTLPMQELLRVIGEAMGGEAGARLSQRLAMKCSRATILRLVCQRPLPSSTHVRVVGGDEWAWRKGQSYGTILVDLEQHLPIDLLEDASGSRPLRRGRVKHPSVEVISRDRGTTFADGATRGAPHALQIADRWHLLRNLGEALEKVLARHHADLKRVFTPAQEQDQVMAALDQQALMRLKALSQAEQLRQARREQHEAVYRRVQELSAQGWSGASIARMLGIHKKTAVKYAAAEHFPERRDRGHKLAAYLLFLQTRWNAGEHNIAALYQAIHAQGYSGSETLVRQYITSLRKEVGPAKRPQRQYPPVSAERKRKPRRAVSSRQATWLALRRPQELSSEDQSALELIMQAHTQLEVACKLAQSFALMIREKTVSALEPWLQEASGSGMAELRTFAAGIKRDQPVVQAALTYSWSQGQVEGQVHRLKLLKRQSYGRAGFELLRHRVLARPA